MADDDNIRMVKLGDIFTEDQLGKVTKLINEIQVKKRSSYDLRDYLQSSSVKAHLMKQEIYPAYLYYMLCCQFELL